MSFFYSSPSQQERTESLEFLFADLRCSLLSVRLLFVELLPPSHFPSIPARLVYILCDPWTADEFVQVVPCYSFTCASARSISEKMTRPRSRAAEAVTIPSDIWWGHVYSEGLGRIHGGGSCGLRIGYL